MSTKNELPQDTNISDLYQSTRDEGPSADLDAAILAQAEAAVAPKPKRPAWIAPVGLAATLFLGVNLAFNLKDYSSAPDVYSESASSVSILADGPEQRAEDESAFVPGASEQDYASNSSNSATSEQKDRTLAVEQSARVHVAEEVLSEKRLDSAASSFSEDARLEGISEQGFRPEASTRKAMPSEKDPIQSEPANVSIQAEPAEANIADFQRRTEAAEGTRSSDSSFEKSRSKLEASDSSSPGETELA